MASFTDKAPTFNPYVSQLPVEAMVKVGMEKQQRYDAGVEKIQTSIDNVAGIDIANPAAKEYLKTKLGQLRTDLRLVAAGDFSNYQLTNSVAGMAKNIVKDKKIQNAMLSTRNLRKGQAEQEVAKKAGKTSPENDLWWNQHVNEYMNNSNLDTVFQGGYIEYTDIDKKLIDIADKIKETETAFEMPYQHDGQGNPIRFDKEGKPTTDGTGEYKIDAAILATKLKGKSAEKIYNTFLNSLSEKDKQQLAITANYHYRGATVGTFAPKIEKKYTQRREMLLEQKSILEVAIRNPKLSPSDKLIKETELNDVKDRLDTGLAKEKAKELAELQNPTDLQNYAYKFYTQEHLMNLSRDLSTQSISKSFKTNPYRVEERYINDFNWKVGQAALDYKKWKLTFDQREEHLKKTTAAKQAEQDAKAAGKRPMIKPGAVATETKKPTLLDVTKENRGLEEDLLILDNDFASTLFPINPYKENGRKKTKEEIDQERIGQKASLDKLYSDYVVNSKEASDINERDYVKSRQAYTKQLTTNNLLLEEILTESEKFEEEKAILFSGEPDIILGGVKYKPQTIDALYNDIKENFYVQPAIGGTFSPTGEITLDREGLMEKYLDTKEETLVREFIKGFDIKAQNLTTWKQQEPNPIFQDIRKYGEELSTKYQMSGHQIDKRKNEFQTEELKKRTSKFQTIDITLNKDDKGDMSMVNALIDAKIKEYNQFNGTEGYDAEDFTPEKVGEIRIKTDAGYTLEKHYDGSAILYITSGGAEQKIKINAGDFRASFSKYTITNPISDIKTAIMATSKRTTNSGGGSNPAGAYFSGWDFQGLEYTEYETSTKVDIIGAKSNNGGENDMFEVWLYYNSPEYGWIKGKVHTEGPLNEAGLQQTLLDIGTRTVKDLIAAQKN